MNTSSVGDMLDELENHINNNTKKANQTLGFLKRNIKVHNQDLKSTAYKTLVRPQLEYDPSVWSPHSDCDIYKIESAQRRAARWATHDYRSTSSVTQMLEKLCGRPLEQRRLDTRLAMLYKITYDLVAMPLIDYLIPNRRESRFIHPWFTDKFTPLPVTTNTAFPKNCSTLERSTHHHCHSPYCGTVQSCCLPCGVCVSLITRQCFILLSILIFFFHCTNAFRPLHSAFISTNPALALGILEFLLKSSKEVKKYWQIHVDSQEKKNKVQISRHLKSPSRRQK